MYSYEPAGRGRFRKPGSTSTFFLISSSSSLDKRRFAAGRRILLLFPASVSAMATAIHLRFSPSGSLSPLFVSLAPQHTVFLSQHPVHVSVLTTTTSRASKKILAMGGDFLGDFGARDPFPEEIESNFGEKVLGNVNTEHKILVPNLAALSLSQQDCTAVSLSHPPMSEDDAKKLLRKVVGWRLLNEETGLKLQCVWKLRDFKGGVELINRIYKVVEAAGHFPSLHLEQPNQVRAELWTSSIGGLSMNDFVVAAKIDEIRTSDLVPKKRIWA